MEPFTGFALFAAGVLLYASKTADCAPSRETVFTKKKEVVKHVHIRIGSRDVRDISSRDIGSNFRIKKEQKK